MAAVFDPETVECEARFNGPFSTADYAVFVVRKTDYDQLLALYWEDEIKLACIFGESIPKTSAPTENKA